MSDWLRRLLSIAAIAGAGALVTGYLAGPVWSSVFLFAYLVITVSIGLRDRARLARWLRSTNLDDTPDVEGPWSDIYASLHRLHRLQKESHASLSHALWRFRLGAEALPDGVLVLDADNRVEWLNPAAARHFAVSLPRDGGRPVAELIRDPAFADYLAAGQFGKPVSLASPGDGGRTLSVQLVPFGDGEKLLLSRDATPVA